MLRVLFALQDANSVNGWSAVGLRDVGESHLIASVGVHDINLPVAVALANEGYLRAVGREGGGEVLTEMCELRRIATICVANENLARPVARISRERELAVSFRGDRERRRGRCWRELAGENLEAVSVGARCRSAPGNVKLGIDYFANAEPARRCR